VNPSAVETESLEAVLAQAWAVLDEGVRQRRGAAHTPTLATVDAQGCAAVRTVVLRACSPATRELLIHTDVRSAKFTELASRPDCALLVYDAALKVQLRIAARATRHADDSLADRQWATSRPMSRAVYGSPLAPGEPVDDPQTAAATLLDRSEAEQRRNFAVLRLEVLRLEWLHLKVSGHRRALFDWTSDATTPRMGWRVP
jgi:pyridoxamine 5'-phosphate oxidase